MFKDPDTKNWTILFVIFLLFSEAYSDVEDIESTLQLLKEGPADFTVKEAVLVLGLMETGKTTLIKILIEDDSLVAKYEGTELVIRDKFGGEIEQDIIYPQFHFENFTKIGFYDCPGFNYQRNTDEDIATAYFINEAAESLESAKILFVFDYPSIQKKGNHEDFIIFLRYAVGFVKSLDNFSKSIGLVVTKVYKNKNDNPQIITKILKYFTDIKKILEKNPELTKNKEEKDQFFKLLKIFENTNIVLFFAPDKPGIVIENKLVKEGISAVYDFLAKLDFKNVKEDEFGYTLSEKSIEDCETLLEMSVEISQNIISNMFVNWDTQQLSLIKKTVEFLELYEIFQGNFGAQSNLKAIDLKIVKSNSNFRNILNLAVEKTKSVHLVAPLINFKKFNSYIIFFESVINSDPTVINYESNELKILYDNTELYYKWYDFLQTVYGYLTTFEGNQANKYIFKNFPELVNIDAKNFERMFDFLSEDSSNSGWLSAFYSVKVSKLNSQQIKEFNTVISSIRVDCIKEGEIARINGTYLDLLDIELFCKKPFKKLSIFASDAVFLKVKDKVQINLNLDELIIIAPTVEVVGSIVLNLDQISKPKKTQTQTNLNGDPGKPGLEGGSLLIISNFFINKENLKVSSIGGIGGEGNSGSPPESTFEFKQSIKCSAKLYREKNAGKIPDPEVECDPNNWGNSNSYCYETNTPCNTPKDGIHIWPWYWYDSGLTSYPQRDCAPFKGDNNLNICFDKFSNTYDSNQFYYQRYNHLDTYYYCNCPSMDYLIQSNIYFQIESPLVNCNGRDGGKAGIGGNPGLITVFHLDKDIKLINQTTQLKGSIGVGGAGGIPLKSQYNKYKDGIGNSFGRPVNPKFKGLKNLYKYVNDFSLSTLGSINQFNKKNILEFYEQMSSSPEILEITGTEALVKEVLLFVNMIKKGYIGDYSIKLFSYLRDKVLTYSKKLFFYQSANCTCNAHNEPCVVEFKNIVYENSSQHHKILATLYISILSEISLLKNDMENDMVINNMLFLNETEKQIDRFLNVEESKELIKNMNASTIEYKGTIDKKIMEGTKLIKSDLLPEINKAVDKLEKQIGKIIKDIEKKYNDTVQYKKALEQAKKDMMAGAIIDGIFGIFKKGAELLGALPHPAAAIAGKTAEFRSDQLQSVSKGIFIGEGDPKALLAMKDQVNGDYAKMKSYYTNHAAEQVKIIRENINKIKEAIKKFSSEYKQNIEVILDHISKWEILAKDEIVNLELLQEEQMTIVSLVQIIINDFKNKGSSESLVESDQGDDEREIKKLERINMVLKCTGSLGSIFLDSFIQGKKDILEADKIINQVDNNLDFLVKIKNQIYAFIFPMVKSISAAMDDYAEDKESNSLISLDLSSWKIIESFKEMRFEISKLTALFPNPDIVKEMEYLFNKLDSTLATIASINERVAKYREDKLYMDHLQLMSNPEFIKIKLDLYPGITNAMQEITSHISSSGVFALYKKAMSSFLQFIFPFASLYVNDFEIPNGLVSGDITSAIKLAKEKLGIIRHKLTLEQATIKAGIDDRVSFKFFNETAGSFPFYSWENNLFFNQIKKFLSGKNIVLYSDILESPEQIQAVKFQTVFLELRPRNETILKNFTEALKYYKVRFLHSGRNHFRFQNKFYIINGPVSSFEVSFAKDQNGDPLEMTGSYLKLKNGDITLSPYTVWNVQILNTGRSKNFNRLKPYLEEKIDVHLIGYGKFIQENFTTPLEVEKYYNPDETLLKMYKQRGTQIELENFGNMNIVKSKMLQKTYMKKLLTGHFKSSSPFF